MFVVLLCFILLDVGSIGQSVSYAGCPAVQDRNQLRVLYDKCFQFVLDQSYEFHVAERYCEEKGGTLAMPKTEQINDFLVAVLRNSFHYNGEVWIGLDDRRYEDLFKWADGTTLVYTTDYTNWATNNGHLANSFFQHAFEDCVILDAYDGLWHDYHCQNDILIFNDYSRHFVCEYQITTTESPTPTTTTTPVPPTTTPKPTVPTTTPEPTTTPPTTTTTPATTACPPFICDLDCGMTGYIVDPATGCTMCECDS